MKSTKQTDKALYSSLTPRWQLYLHTRHATIRRRRRRSHPPVSNQISNSRHLTSSSISVVLLFLLSAFISPPSPSPSIATPLLLFIPLHACLLLASLFVSSLASPFQPSSPLERKTRIFSPFLSLPKSQRGPLDLELFVRFCDARTFSFLANFSPYQESN